MSNSYLDPKMMKMMAAAMSSMPPRLYQTPKFSPGMMVKVSVTDGIFRQGDLWLIEIVNKNYVQVTTGARTEAVPIELAEILFDSTNEKTKEKYAEDTTPKSLDFTPLDKLIIRTEVREEIVSVLKQHQHSKKLFVEWGLGEMIEYGRGMTFMFYGPPGTGKTWGAKCIAKAMGQEVLTIDAANIQTSEPGGANRNIKNAFQTAKEQKKVLFIDECDSLITNRDHVGMILGGEINTLLTEIEKFEGVCILATNRIDTLDEALERRISLIVEFPEPNFEQRKMIWQSLLPKKMPLDSDVDVTKLAEYSLTGGQIKNALLQAARLALAAESDKVTFAHFESAIKRVQKSKNLMGTASSYREATVRDDLGVSVGKRRDKVKVPDMDVTKVAERINSNGHS